MFKGAGLSGAWGGGGGAMIEGHRIWISACKACFSVWGWVLRPSRVQVPLISASWRCCSFFQHQRAAVLRVSLGYNPAGTMSEDFADIGGTAQVLIQVAWGLTDMVPCP